MGLYGGGRSVHWDSSSARAALANVEPMPKLPERISKGGFNAGMRVFHEKFGTGTVVHADGQKLDVKFDHAGLKRVMDSFVREA
jgi:DNA helicase-2/ATP-dependent DNA helicase PcrA